MCTAGLRNGSTLLPADLSLQVCTPQQQAPEKQTSPSFGRTPSDAHVRALPATPALGGGLPSFLPTQFCPRLWSASFAGRPTPHKSPKGPPPPSSVPRKKALDSCPPFELQNAQQNKLRELRSLFGLKMLHLRASSPFLVSGFWNRPRASPREFNLETKTGRLSFLPTRGRSQRETADSWDTCFPFGGHRVL